MDRLNSRTFAPNNPQRKHDRTESNRAQGESMARPSQRPRSEHPSPDPSLLSPQQSAESVISSLSRLEPCDLSQDALIPLIHTLALCLDRAVRSNEASSFGAARPALETLIRELATFFLPDMLKMLKAFGILVHYEDELPPAFGGSATDLPLPSMAQALSVASAPTPPPLVLPTPRSAPRAPPRPPCSLLCPSAKPSFVKVVAAKATAPLLPTPSKSSIYAKVGTRQGTRATW